jgi:hypothetical protein
VEPYITPSLGKNYMMQWIEEDRSMMDTSELSTPLKAGKGLENQIQKYATDEDNVISPETYCGPLTERILAALMEEDIITGSDLDPSDSEDSGIDVSGSPTHEKTKVEMQSIEDRVRQELHFIGLLDDEEVGECGICHLMSFT